MIRLKRFSITTANEGLSDLKYFILKRGAINVSKFKDKSKDNVKNLPLEIKNCYENSNTFIGSTEVKTDQKTFFDDLNMINDSFNTSSAIFLEFADVVISRSDYLGWFLNEYGFLSSKEDLIKISGKEAKLLDNGQLINTNNEIIYSEPLSLWVLAQVRIRSLIRLWRFLKAVKNNKIENSYYYLLFEYEKGTEFSDVENDRYINTVLQKDLYGQIFDNDFKKELNFKLSPKIDVDKYLTSDGIKNNISSLDEIQKLSIFASEYIEKNLNDLFQDNKFSPKTVFNYNLGNKIIERKSYQYIQYNSLLQLIFYQLMDAIIKDKKFSRCMECQNWFEVIETGKKGKIYCGANCRARAYRRRKEIKQINAFSDPNSEWSISNIVLKWSEIIANGNKADLKKYENEFNNKFSDKTIQRTMKTIRDNIFDNVIKWCTITTLAEHLDIDPKALAKLEDITPFYDNFHEDPEYVMTYIDWDKNHRWHPDS